MTWLLVLLASLLALGSHPYVVQGAEQTVIANAEDGSLHIVSEKDVHINTTANNHVFLNGIDVVKQLVQQQRIIDTLVQNFYNNRVVNFGQITSVGGDIDLRNNELTSVDFGQMTSVGGYIDLDDNGLTSVKFGQITSVGGDIELDYNDLTTADFGQITSVGRSIDLDDNNLTSVDFGQITGVGGDIRLINNDLTTIDFGQITSVGGGIDLYRNNLTTIDFGQITNVGGDIDLHNSHLLASVDCTGVAINGCICVDAGVSLTNCPDKCTYPYCNI